MRRFFGLVLVSVFLFAAGCGDDDSGHCVGVTSPCPTAGALQCNAAFTGLESCAADAQGCLVWTASTTCSLNQACAYEATGAACTCDNSCTAGHSECRGAVIWACTADTDGCLGMARGTDCAATSESCAVTADTAACVSTCTTPCTPEDATRCNTANDAIETCTDAGGGCLQWQETTDCTTTDQLCDDTGVAACVDECVPDCTTAAATRCNAADDAIETCADAGGGCLQWRETTDCTTTDQICDDTGTAACVDECVPTCTTAAATQCNAADDAIETCTDVDGCLLWQETTACLATETCDDTSGTPDCAPICTDACTTAGDTQCSGSVIQTCGMGAEGCLVLTDGTDCADTSQACNDTAEPAVCEVICTPDCTTEDALQCTATETLETCTDVGAGCLQWQLTDNCPERGLACDDAATPPACGGLIAAGSCAAPIPVIVSGLMLAGTNFLTDFADHQSLAGTDCVTRTGSSDAVFSVALTAGESVVLREMGGLDAVLSLQTTCGDTAACVFSEDYGETTGYRYDATADGTVYLIVEAWYATTTTTDYDIRIDVFPPENCTDTVDNDGDTLVDCDDPGCFGLTGCTTETNCDDGADNDGDGSTDCTDSDCSAIPACAPYEGIYDAFAPPVTDPFDLEGAVLTFTPSTTDPNGYTWAVTSAGGVYAVTPGSGAPTSTLTLGDDASTDYVFSTMTTGFPFYGATYTHVFVGSNGFLTFGTSYNYPIDTQSEFFAQPIVAGLSEDLDPRATGAAVTVDEFADSVAITFNNVPFYGETVYNQFQTILFADGRIQFVYLAVPVAGFDSGDTPFVGVGNGVGVTPYPAEVDFVPPPPEICTDAIDNDRDGATDCNDPDCFGATGCTTETNCTDGADNDADGTTDCADADCNTAPACWSTLFSQDFETDPAWTLAGDWQWGTPAYASGPAACAGGTGCYGTNMTGNYSLSTTYATNYLQFGPIDLSTRAAATLLFDMWIRTESTWDWARLEVSTDGTTFNRLDGVTPPYTVHTRDTGWTGTTYAAWTPASVDLAAFVGSATVYFRFALSSDSTLAYPGFYVDNVRVTAR
jgi:hypothetical protein